MEGKRPISEKQRDNLRKGMAVLKAKREALRRQQEEEATNISEPSVKEKPPNQPPEVKPIVREKKKKNLSVDDFNNFKNELLTSMKPSVQIVEKPIEKIVEVEKVVEKFVDRPVDRVVEKIVEKPVNRVISGSELLDRLFFTKK